MKTLVMRTEPVHVAVGLIIPLQFQHHNSDTAYGRPRTHRSDSFGVVITDGHLVTNGLMLLLPPGITKAAVKPYYDAYTGGQISEADFWQGIGLMLDSPIRNQFLNVFELDADLAAVTYALSKHYRLGILSNLGAEWGEMLEERFAFSERFEPRIISGAVKCQKL